MLARTLSPHAERAYALLRIVAGLLFAIHGAQKLFGILGGTRATEAQMILGGVIEFAGGLLIALGLFTRLAAFVASGEMAVAYVQFHWLKSGVFLPTAREQGGNGGELALLYAFVFLFVACKGSGIWSLSAARRRSVG